MRNRAIVAISGFDSGRAIFPKIWNWVAPSICADSMMDSGMLVLKNVLQITTLNEETQSGRISAQILFFRLRNCVLTT